MSGRDDGILDLLALPALGSEMLAARPSLLFSADGRRVLFANPAGAAFLGAASLAALRARRFSPDLPATGQIARAARSLPPGGSRLERIRFAGSAGFAGIAAECGRVNLPDGEPALLVRLPAPRVAASAREAAERLIAFLAAPGRVVAVVDAEGRVIAEGEGAGLKSLPEGLPLLTAAAASTTSPMHRMLTIGGQPRPATLLPLGPGADAPVLLLLDETPLAAAPILTGEEAALPADAAASEPPVVAEPDLAIEAAPVSEAEAGSARADDAGEPPTQPEPPSEQGPGDRSEAVAGEGPAPTDGTTEPLTGAATPFQFAEPSAPVRFVFQMDAEGRFTFISPNFAEWVGPSATILVGEDWSSLAARLGLDPEDAVAALLARRDTWSGATLDWPVSGSDRLLAVDLAALPAFSRERRFEGYRGFGVIRASERRRIAEPPQQAASAVEAPQPRPVAPAASESAPASNVIRLPLPNADGERLSPPEQDAFRRIAAALTTPAAEAAAKDAPAATAVEPESEMPPAGSPQADPAEAEMQEAPPSVEPAEPLETPDAPFAEDEAEPDAAGADEEHALRAAEREADLSAARQRIVELEAILDTATDGVLVLDEAGHIETLNRSAEALFSVDAASVAGMPITDLLAEESRQSALDYLDGLTQNGVASVLNDGREVIGRVPQGGLIPLFMTMGRLPDTGKFCAVLRDITQWKNAEGELINAKRAAESASMQKSDFLAKVSHEIRTPLNAIIGFSEVMMEERFGPIGTERYKEYLRDIHLSGAHLMSLLNDLLDISKIEAGKLDLNFESVALNDIVMECVALMQPQANRERIIIRTSLSGQVPNVVADPRSIRQIVLNLVSNAVKFTLAGGQVIVSTAMEPHGEVTLRIRDTGIGMSEKDVETALKPFRQLSASRERRSDGTGLGLPLTKALVEANRAAFAIDSAVGQGTLIRITFPSTRVLAG